MKKISMLFLSLFAIVLITGCGEIEKKEQVNLEETNEKTLVCSTTTTEDGMDNEQIISMTYKNDKLNHMTMEVKMKFTDADIKENWEEFKKSEDLSEDFEKDGISLKSSFNDQNYEYSTVLDIDVANVSEEVLKEQGLEGLKEDTSTLEESKEAAEQEGANCVIK